MHNQENLAAMFANLVDMASFYQIRENFAADDPHYARSMMIVIGNVETCHAWGEA